MTKYACQPVSLANAWYALGERACFVSYLRPGEKPREGIPRLALALAPPLSPQPSPSAPSPTP